MNYEKQLGWRILGIIEIKPNSNYAKSIVQVEAGLYQADSHQLVPIDNCLVQQPATTKVMNTLVDLLNDFQLPIYDERKNSGIFRTLMVQWASKLAKSK